MAKQVNEAKAAGKKWEIKDKLELGLEKARQKVAEMESNKNDIENDINESDVPKDENVNSDEGHDAGTHSLPFNPLTGDPMTLTGFLYPGKEWTEVSVDADELSREIDYIESLKPAQLKSEAFKWFYRSKAMQQWIDEAQNRLKIARKRGDSIVNIPMPTGSFDKDEGMSELMKTLAPLIVMKNMFDEEKSKGYSLMDLHNVYKSIKEDATSSSEKRLVKIEDAELGELEVTPELAMFIKYLQRGKDSGEKSSGDEMILIEDGNGNKKYVPRDIYMFELARDMYKPSARDESTDKTNRVISSLLRTIEAQTSVLNGLNERLNKIEEIVASDVTDIDKFVSFLESFSKLKKIITEFNDRSSNPERNVEVEKLKLLGKLVGSTGDDKDDEDRDEYDVNAVMQRSRQESEKLLRELKSEDVSVDDKAKYEQMEEIPIAESVEDTVKIGEGEKEVEEE